MVMPFGRSDAGLESVSDYRASVINACARSRVCNALFRQSFAGVAFGGVAFVGVARLHALAANPARNRFQRETRVVRRAGTCSQRIVPIAIPAPPAQQVAVAERVFPRLVKKALVGECRREVIVAGRGRKSRASCPPFAISAEKSRAGLLCAIAHRASDGTAR